MNHYHIFSASAQQAADLYQNFIIPYFPEDEVKPLKSILRMMAAGSYKILCISSEPEPENISAVAGIAFLTTCTDADCYLLDYLAIHETYRSKGLGSILLKECTRFTNGLPIFIETESVATAKNDAQRQQRISRNRFYEKNGAQPTGVRSCIFTVVYDNWILSSQSDLASIEETESCLAKLYRFMVPDTDLYEKHVRIPY